VLVISLPVFASTPEEENAPSVTKEDGMFLDMTQLTEEELIGIEGNRDDQSGGQGWSTIIDIPNNNPTVWEANKNSYDITSAGTSTGIVAGGYYDNPYLPKPTVIL
jgi:hypothetical protein